MRHIEKQELMIEFDSALENLNSGIYSFSAVAKRLAARVREVEEQEAIAKELLREAEVRTADLGEREKQLTDRETRLREREAQVLYIFNHTTSFSLCSLASASK